MPAIFRGFRKIVAAMSCLLSYPSAFPEGHRCPQVISVGRSFKKHPLSPMFIPVFPVCFISYISIFISPCSSMFPTFSSLNVSAVTRCYKMLQLHLNKYHVHLFPHVPPSSSIHVFPINDSPAPRRVSDA